MAKIKLSAIGITAIRGSIGGTTFSSNRGGIYVKNWAKPSNPMTPAQTALRNMFGSVVRSWKTLTAAQIGSWNAYAQGRTTTDILGESRPMSGRGAFISVNQNRLHVGWPILKSAPTPVKLLAFHFAPYLSFEIDIANPELTVETPSYIPLEDVDTNVVSLRITHYSPASRSFKPHGQGVSVRQAVAGANTGVDLTSALAELGVSAGDQILVSAHMHNTEGLKSNVVTQVFTVV